MKKENSHIGMIVKKSQVDKAKRFWGGFRYKSAAIMTLLFLVVMLFVVDHSLFNILKLGRQLKSLKRETEAVQSAARADSTFIEMLKDDDFLEKYAREKFYMKRPGEEIYIIEK